MSVDSPLRRTTEWPRPESPPARPPWVLNVLRSPTGRGVRVGVIDSGWDRAVLHPRVVKGVGLVDPDDELALRRSTDDNDRIGHGTACADLILQMAPEVEIVPIRVFGRQLETSPSLLCAALEEAVNRRIHIVNLSLGTQLAQAGHALYAACETACRSGLIIVAAGHRRALWSYPAVFDNVIGVTAGAFRNPFEFQYRPHNALECVSKGLGQRALWWGTRKTMNGTSFAAPNITAIIALLRQRYPLADLTALGDLLAQYARQPAPNHHRRLLADRLG